jgi:hypothetical protein
VRESRLMAKFDHFVNLPQIFKENQLSILPTSRSQYAIGHFETHCKVEYGDRIALEIVDFPPMIESIDYTNLYSESAVLNCAFNTGIIDRLAGETMLYTLSGRMSTEQFQFSINNIRNNGVYQIDVDRSQCEIDAGFEGSDRFFLLEAKMGKIDDFLIRQLYYPYRLWSQKLNKTVIPVLMTYSNDIFSFFLYRFKNPLNYNSIELIDQKNYIINCEEISRTDLEDLWKNIEVKPERDRIPFPQADKFERVVDLLSLLVNTALTKEEITGNYQFDERQTSYYTDAARYLGLVCKEQRQPRSSILYALTPEGRSILQTKHKYKVLALIRQILEHEVFYRVFAIALEKGEIPEKREIIRIMNSSNLAIQKNTIERRATTVRAWIDWIRSQLN